MTKHLLLLLLVPVMTLSSCVKETAGDGPKGSNVYTFTLNVPVNSTPAARGISDDDEYTVKTADVLAFNASTKKFLYAAFSMNQIEPVEGTSGVDRKIRFTVSLEDKEIAKYDFIVLANCRDRINAALAGMDENTSKEDAQALITQTIEPATGWVTTKGTTYKNIPMWGEINDKALSMDQNYNTSLVRMLARIDLSVALDQSKHAATDELKILQVKLYNYQKEGYVIPAAANVGTNDKNQPKVTEPSILADQLVRANPVTYTVPTEGDNAGKLVRDIYVFEAPKGDLTDFADNICLVFQGRYTTGGVAKTGWYRIDFANNKDNLDAEYLPIKRNHRYNVLITMISGEGYPNETIAYESKPVNVETAVVEWANGGFNNVKWDGQNYLAVSENKIKEGRESANPMLRLQTSVKGWTARLSGSEDSITAVPKDTDTGEPWLSATGLGGSGEEAIESIKLSMPENTTNGSRTAYIHLTAGRLNMVIPVTQTIDTQMGISIYDVDAENKPIGEPLTGIEFAEALSGTEMRHLLVKWSPADADMRISNTVIGGSSFVFHDGVNVFESKTVSGAQDKGEYFLDIKPGTLAASSDPFYEQNIMALFSVQSKGKTFTQTLTVRHFRYNGKVETDGAYLMDGKRKSFTVKSNAPWKAYYVSQLPGAGKAGKFINTIGGNDAKWQLSDDESTDYATPIASGMYNLPDGDVVDFTVINELYGKTPELYTGKGHIVIVADDNPADLGNPYYSEKKAELFCCSALIRGEANSYIIDNRNDLYDIPIMIPLSQITKAEQQFPEIGTLVNNLDDCTTEILWSDRSADWTGTTHKKADDAVVKDVLFVKGADIGSSYVMVFPGSSMGNTSVALKENGTVKWSWHIWNVDYFPYKDYFATAGNLETTDEWMDRNLGAITNNSAGGVKSYGLLYQFGRKDPFSGSGRPYYPSSMNTDNSSNRILGPVSLTLSINTPQVFYHVTQSGGNWTTSTKSDLWNQSGKAKSALDPSPEGYRLPVTFPHSKANEDSAGATFNKGYSWSSYGGWYPAPGYRHHGDGVVTSIGTAGSYWSCIPQSGTHGRYLYLVNGSVSPQNPTPLSNGDSIRCIAE